jgi:hypothetical protein
VDPTCQDGRKKGAEAILTLILGRDKTWHLKKHDETKGSTIAYCDSAAFNLVK